MSSFRSNKIRLLLILFLLASLAQSAFSQSSTTGSIVGVVRDPSGAAVPGVTVTASGPNLIRPQSATSAGDGSYQILNLPPGRYLVTAPAIKGFAKYEQRDVDVNLGRSSAADITLQVSTTQTEISVSAGAPVDVVTTTVGSNVSADQFSNFPTARTVQSLYNIAPTVTRSGLRDSSGRDRDPSVAGSSGPENNYILDGVNTSDPAFGGGGANLPFEFVQEVQVMTGAFSAEYGKSTGGILNVITKSGGNNVHGDVFGYFTTKGLVREVKNFPYTGSAANGFSEQDIGGDIGGPIKKDKLWFFGAVNPQWRKNYFLTQTFHAPVENKVTIPFYAGKITYALNDKNTLTVSTFGDFLTVDGFLSNAALNNVNGFGSDPVAFLGKQQTGGHNYAFRLNSAITPRFIAEFSGGLHFQRANTIPRAIDEPQLNDTFAVLRGGAVLPVTQTGFNFGSTTGFVDYVDGRGGSLQRNFLRGPGFGLYGPQDRNRFEFSAHLQNTFSKHSLKYGFEWFKNIYNIGTVSSGPDVTFANSSGLAQQHSDDNVLHGYRVNSNAMSVCTVRSSVIVCPSSAAQARLAALPAASLPAGLTVGPVGTITADEALNNPFLVRLSTRVRDFELVGKTSTRVFSNYIQDDWRLTKNVQLNLGLRWDWQASYGNGGATYMKLQQFIPNTQPRLGAIWDFTGKGKGKFFVNYGRFVEAPIPLDVNVRAGGGDVQTDKNFNVNRYSAPAGSIIVPGITSSQCPAGSGITCATVNLGSDATPIDPGIRPPMIEEYAAGFEYEAVKDLVLGVRGVYRNYVNIIEDGSFDDGNTYFLFNPGRRVTDDLTSPAATTEDRACNDPTIGCFGKARRYYRAIEVTARKRFTGKYQFIASYTYSSLIGNYEGLFRNDNGQSDPNITSLFDLVSLLDNLTGRLPNDRPHQFKFNGSYRTPIKLMVSGNWYVQSGTPFNELIPHPVYGNNEGFGLPRGTAIVPAVAQQQPGFPNVVDSVGNNRSPLTWNLDLGFYYPIKVGEGKELRLVADWFNVFNQQRAVTLDQTFQINSGVTGVAPVTNPFYGSALLVQAPSQWRFGAKFSF
jgi:outer membrane receptor protein involved in Fe transport